VLIVLVAFGCALGGLCRYALGSWVARKTGAAFPWGTLVVNAIGSFLLGAVLGAGIGPEGEGASLGGIHALLAIGFCGGLTTFSTFSLQSLNLLSRQAWPRLVGNVVGSVVLCLFCCLGGYALLERWTG
jgi:CrcB protein